MVEAEVWLNALALFIPAMIGIFGSYGLYRMRQEDSKENLKVAFLAELRGTGHLDIWPDTGIPSYNFLSVSVYESNTESLGLLSNSEVVALVRYYTRAKSLQDALRIHSEIIAQTEGSFESDVKRGNREKGLRNGIDKLELARQRAILTIEKERGNAQLPKEGTNLSNLPETLQEDRAILLDFELADETSNGEVIITERGAEFFRGDMNLAGVPREHDVLERNKSWYRIVAENLWGKISELVYKR